MIRPKKHEMARNILSDSLLTVGENVLLKSTSWFCEKSCTTSLALYRATDPSGWYLTLNTYFDPIAYLSSRSRLYSQVLWFSRFWISSPLTSLYCRECTGPTMTFLYVFGLWILLLVSVANIAFLIISVTSATLSSTLLSSSGSICYPVGFSVTCIFLGRPLDLGSPVGAFLFDAAVWRVGSRGYSSSSFAPCSDSSTYGLLTRKICCVFGANARICFVVSWLYPMKIPFQFL